MSLTEILALPAVAFLALFLKGIAGIGVSTVAVPILSLIIGAKQIVVLSSIVNVIGGLLMYRIDPQPAPRRYWWPIAALMIIGAVLGGIALKLTPLKSFEKILGITILTAGIWFIIWRGKQKSNSFLQKLPEKSCLKDYGVGFLGGLAGGFVGINSPIDIHSLFRQPSCKGSSAPASGPYPFAPCSFKCRNLYRSGFDEHSDYTLQSNFSARIAPGSLCR